MSELSIQFASDIVRDGLGVELVNESREVVAEVFRCDLDGTFYASTFCYDVSLADLERLIRVARTELGPFEDGTPLADARPMPPRLIPRAD